MTRAGVLYQDPLDVVWLHAAARLGMRVQRSAEVYASWDGRGTLTLSDAAGMDPDDSLAQLIFHECCHALVQGPRAWQRVDWGLDNVDDRDVLAEHAAIRLQAALADRYGLRDFLGVTTSYRPYFDALPPNPLAPGEDPAIAPAQEGFLRATRGDAAPVLAQALDATARLAAVLAPLAPPGSLWARARAPHPLGLPPGDGDRRCGDCAWRDPHDRCLQAQAPLDPGWAACRAWEPRLGPTSCGPCGACCREGFGEVAVEPDSPLLTTHPGWVVQTPEGPALPRPGGRCPALAWEGSWRCTVYTQRPQSCQDFEVGGEHCLSARRRVGLSW